ncbi:MAG: DEAD/DEAH box helicase family protein, partial [candidate division Zixibacteria bacterium]|nr:DEAD/DEAH box helicase family protein [candidate division Zixibacteria bacterium]
MPLEIGFPFRAGPTLSYEAPKGVEPKALLGCRVVAPLGSKKEIGVVVGLNAPRTPGLKSIEKVIDAQPAYLSSILSLIRWAADYYISPLGPALRAAVPGEVQSKIYRKINFLLPSDSPVPEELSRTEKELFFFLSQKKEVGLKKLASRFPKASLNRHLLDFERRGWIASYEVLEKAPGVRKITCVAANISERPAKDEKRKDLILFLLDHSGFHPLSDLVKRFSVSPGSISKLAQKGLVLIEKKTEEELAELMEKKEIALSPQQKSAFADICQTLGAGKFSPFLLFGVTGSGKTEVYFAAIDEVLNQGRQALVLLPEISVASQIIARFRARFGNQVAALHSGLTPGQKASAWKAIRSGAYPIVVGVRSAVFAPLEKPGIIVVDEEHSPSYKQTEAVPYY